MLNLYIFKEYGFYWMMPGVVVSTVKISNIVKQSEIDQNFQQIETNL